MFLTRAEYTERTKERYEDPEVQEDIAIAQTVLALLGVLDEEDDLRQILADARSERVLGFFDLQSGELAIVSDSGDFGLIEEITYAHEFGHWLQQRHHDIAAASRRLEQDSEASAGLQALIEGDATLLMLRYMSRHIDRAQVLLGLQGDTDGGGADIPPFILANLAFPYSEGLEFVLDLYRDGGWEAVDSAYDSPPTTTEQVLHPDKYRAGEGPIAVDLLDVAAALGEGWTERESDAIGEFDLRLILEEHLPKADALRAAEGWGGDRFIYAAGPGGSKLMVSLIVWDSEEDATEFFDSYGTWLRARGNDPTGDALDLSWGPVDMPSSLRVRGARTLLLIAPSEAIAARVVGLFDDFRSS